MKDDKILYQKHSDEQLLRWAFETTPYQRLQFVEDALEFVYASGQNYHEIKRKQFEESVKTKNGDDTSF